MKCSMIVIGNFSMAELKEASEDFDNLNHALRSLAASIEDHINQLTQGKKPEEY